MYKIPLLLLAVELFLWIFGLIPVDAFSALLWTGIYSIFVFVGMAIAFLLHFAFRKEKTS